MTPNVLEATAVPGVPRLTMLNAFVASARNIRLTRSVNLNVRDNARSTSRYPGALRKLRGELPFTNTPVVALFCANAAMLNHSAAVGFEVFGSPINCALSV